MLRKFVGAAVDAAKEHRQQPQAWLEAVASAVAAVAGEPGVSAERGAAPPDPADTAVSVADAARWGNNARRAALVELRQSGEVLLVAAASAAAGTDAEHSGGAEHDSALLHAVVARHFMGALAAAQLPTQ
jgi:hypothetical protein